MKTFDRRRNRAGARRDDRFLVVESLPCDFDLSFADETRITKVDVDAEFRRVALCRVFLTDPRTDFAHASHDLAKVSKILLGDRHAITRCLPGFVHELCATNHRLRRDASDIETIAAHQMPLDQCDPSPETRSDQRRDEPTRPRTYDDQVVTTVGRRILPIRGMNVLHESFVPLVRRLDLDSARHLEFSFLYESQARPDRPKAIGIKRPCRRPFPRRSPSRARDARYGSRIP